MAKKKKTNKTKNSNADAIEEKIEKIDFDSYTVGDITVKVRKDPSDDEIYCVESKNPSLDKICQYVPLYPIFSNGNVLALIITISNPGTSREYICDVRPECYGIPPWTSQDNLPEEFIKIMKYNCRIRKVNFDWSRRQYINYVSRASGIVFEPPPKPSNGEVLDKDENGKLIVRKDLRGKHNGKRGRQVSPERRKLLDEQKELKEKNPDKIVEIIDDKVVVRDRKRKKVNK